MIGILDSGIGGVTVLNHIRKLLKHQHFIYYSDSKNNPYGEKPEQEIYDMVKNIVEYLIQKGCQTIVIACNTASAICSSRLRKEYPTIRIIAIEPALKVVKDGQYKGLTLVLATSATLKSQKFLNTYQKYKTEQTVLVPCKGLANDIEENNQEKINEFLQNLKKEYPETKNIVLGCTHYPLIQNRILEYFKEVNFFDGGIGVSRLLQKEIQDKNQKEVIEFIDSSESIEKQNRFYNYINNENKEIKKS